MKKLAEYLDLIPSEIMAIGNADNDIPMIKYAGTGIAMASSTPTLLKIADYKTASNNIDGIEKAIKKFIL